MVAFWDLEGAARVAGVIGAFDRGLVNVVIASAHRVTGRRHSACVTRRIAEISVPAWLMPIQKTKLTM